MTYYLVVRFCSEQVILKVNSNIREVSMMIFYLLIGMVGYD